LNELREHCLEAYTGIIQGLKGEDDKNINCAYYIKLFDLASWHKTLFRHPSSDVPLDEPIVCL